MLIVCEGERTEPNYFGAFPVLASHVVTVRGAGMNTLSLVEETVRLSGQEAYDEVWAVFDRDSFKEEQVAAAHKLANLHGVHVAFSDEAFEVWYLMYFDYCDAALSRTTHQRRLSDYLGIRYEKNDPRMYEILKPHMMTANRNAKKLLVHHGNASVCGNPSTTVHLLVERLCELAHPSME